MTAPHPVPRPVTCGVLVTDGTRVLIGHATRTPRWDIPKGLADPGEDHAGAAVRELREETGLLVPPGDLHPLGLHPYLRNKDLVLFAWHPPAMPDPATLSCASLVTRPGHAPFPELDRFAVLPWDEAMSHLTPNLARVLAPLRPDLPAAP